MPEQSVACAFPEARATRSAAGRAKTTRGRIVPGRYHARPVRIETAHPLVLGSASPRRREMISWLGVPFVAVRNQVITDGPGQLHGAQVDVQALAGCLSDEAPDAGDERRDALVP